jgi:glutathione synthase/RimK-type ligase-like ATP-grasp enzyme
MHVALVTATAFADLDDDLPHLTAALRAEGHEPTVAAWDDGAVDWAAFDVAAIRSTWDYVERRHEFLAWVDRVEAVTRLANPGRLVRWNTSKRYLRELGAAGVPVVPTAWPTDGEPIPPAWGEVVVKPAVSAGGRLTGRYDDHEEAAAFARTLVAQGHDVLVQPYVGTVDSHGEFGIFFFGGHASHAIRKGAILSLGQEPVPDHRLAVGQTAVPVAVEESPVAFARSVLDAVPGGAELLYARVDCVVADDGSPLVLEVEMVEPHLFLATTDGGAARFAAAVSAWAAR